MLKCMMTNSTQWAHDKPLNPKGIVIHSSGRKGPYLRRYIQPTSSDPQFDELRKILGTNTKKVDWNHRRTQHNFHYWIGKTADKEVVTIQTFPLTMRTWLHDNYIHICICEDSLKDKKYLKECLVELISLCEDLCRQFNWGTDKIYDNSEISDLTPDSNYWLEKHGYSIDWVRNEVDKIWQNKKFSV